MTPGAATAEAGLQAGSVRDKCMRGWQASSICAERNSRGDGKKAMHSDPPKMIGFHSSKKKYSLVPVRGL